MGSEHHQLSESAKPPKVTAPGHQLDSPPLIATTSLPSADLLKSKLPTRTPLDQRDHATTSSLFPKVTAPGHQLDSPPMLAPTSLPSADLLKSKLPTRTPLDQRDHATTSSIFDHDSF